MTGPCTDGSLEVQAVIPRMSKASTSPSVACDLFSKSCGHDVAIPATTLMPKVPGAVVTRVFGDGLVFENFLHEDREGIRKSMVAT